MYIYGPNGLGKVQSVWPYTNWECRILVKILMKDSNIKFHESSPVEPMFSHVDRQDELSSGCVRLHGCT